LTVFAVTRRDAAGWRVLPFQGERTTAARKRKTILFGTCAETFVENLKFRPARDDILVEKKR
jgi:hypothetical protein